jgi:hypothetical protein
VIAPDFNPGDKKKNKAFAWVDNRSDRLTENFRINPSILQFYKFLYEEIRYYDVLAL